MLNRSISNLRARKQSEFYATPSGEQAPPARQAPKRKRQALKRLPFPTLKAD
jgi:hypothetical protein